MRRDKDPRERIKYFPSLFHLAHPIDGKMSGSLLVTQPYFGRGQAVLSTKEDCVMSASAAPIDCTLDIFFIIKQLWKEKNANTIHVDISFFFAEAIFHFQKAIQQYKTAAKTEPKVNV